MPTARYYVDLGKASILELLEFEQATLWPEIEARIGDVRWPTATHPVDPHHLTTARQELLAEGEIEESGATTRGGRLVTVQHLPLSRGNRRLVRVAGERKRLLYARHQGWAQASVRHPSGLIGPAGEAVLHASLVNAAIRGRYSLLGPDAGDIAEIFGKRIAGGPVDSGAIHAAISPTGGGVVPVTLLIEVKNVRHWIYPASDELYQLLSKVAEVQVLNPGHLFLPVLVCRRRHFTTLAMGQDLGFYTIQTTRQYVMPSKDIHGTAFNAVKVGLGYADLTLRSDEDPALTTVLRDLLPRDVLGLAHRWQARATDFLPIYRGLRVAGVSSGAGQLLFARLRDEAADFDDALGRW